MYGGVGDEETATPGVHSTVHMGVLSMVLAYSLQVAMVLDYIENVISRIFHTQNGWRKRIYPLLSIWLELRH